MLVAFAGVVERAPAPRVGAPDPALVEGRAASSPDPRPAIIDMPTMWVHSITNTGPGELITLFYADEVFDPESPDTYPEEV